MISKNVLKALNEQISLEFDASNTYLAMASWAEVEGFAGCSNFLYQQSNEERVHAMKIFHYVNDRGGMALVPAMKAPSSSFKSIRVIFNGVLENEERVSASINKLVELCMQEKDYTTQNFLQWYVTEQQEEETQARAILDKLKLLGDSDANLYLFDRDLEQIAAEASAGA